MALAIIYFASELLSTDIHFTIAFLIITALILSGQVNLYRKDSVHKHKKLKRNILCFFKNQARTSILGTRKTSQELFIKDEAENLYDIIRFKQNEEAQELIDYLLTPNPLDKKIDHFYRDKLENIKLPDLRVLFEAKFLKAKELDVWVSMEVPEPITVYPIYPLDWVYSLSTILIMSLTKHKIVNRNILAMLILKTRIVNTLSLRVQALKKIQLLPLISLIPN